LQTVRYLLQAVASLLKTLVVALQQGLTAVAHPVTGLLSGVVGKVWQTMRHWLQGLLQEEPEEQSGQRQQGREGQQQPGQQSGQRAPAAAAA
jgi:hypothetical protein